MVGMVNSPLPLLNLIELAYKLEIPLSNVTVISTEETDVDVRRLEIMLKDCPVGDVRRVSCRQNPFLAKFPILTGYSRLRTIAAWIKSLQPDYLAFGLYGRRNEDLAVAAGNAPARAQLFILDEGTLTIELPNQLASSAHQGENNWRILNSILRLWNLEPLRIPDQMTFFTCYEKEVSSRIEWPVLSNGYNYLKALLRERGRSSRAFLLGTGYESVFAQSDYHDLVLKAIAHLKNYGEAVYVPHRHEDDNELLTLLKDSGITILTTEVSFEWFLAHSEGSPSAVGSFFSSGLFVLDHILEPEVPIVAFRPRPETYLFDENSFSAQFHRRIYESFERRERIEVLGV